jgi:SAM-dependent methyltransferase
MRPIRHGRRWHTANRVAAIKQVNGIGYTDRGTGKLMRKQYIEVPLALRCRGLRSNVMKLKGNLLGPIFWLAAWVAGGPGLGFHLKCAGLGLLALVTRRLKRGSYGLIFFPMDSTRYFEFHEAWTRLKSLPFKRYLDVSSPRLLPFMLARANARATVELINPDPKDIRDTEQFFTSFRVNQRCRFRGCTIEQTNFSPSSFDLITCLSVLEHIPADRDAVRQMWTLLSPGGRLVLTMPCRKERLEQYISFNQYGVLAPGSDGYTFWQRFYDAEMLQATVFAITGPPEHVVFYGEKTNGFFFRNATLKRVLGGRYPFWREPYIMATEYRYYPAIDGLPGDGVVYLEFLKR